jgi:predicted ArsR family transcriptional regulator
MDRPALASEIAAIAVLGEPTRRALYFFVASQPEPVSRDQAAGALSIGRGVAALHLDRLADEGLLDVEFRRLTGRSGPGAGRPAKLYRRSARQVAVSLPERRYDLAAKVMADALRRARHESDVVDEALRRAARELGRALAHDTRGSAGRRAGRRALLAAAISILEGCGFEPRREDGRVVLRNCPFRALADEYRDVVCSMNRELHEGLLEGLAVPDLVARGEPEPDGCCVTYLPASASG